MKAVILAAGLSTRTYPLTVEVPKPMLRICGKPLLEHTLDEISGYVDEIILVVGFKKGLIKDYFGGEHRGIKVTYAVQEEQLGTGNALLGVQTLVSGDFLVMMGDDFYCREDIERCIQNRPCILSKEIEGNRNFGVLEEKKGVLVRLHEKLITKSRCRINCGLYVLNASIFDILKRLKVSPRGEYELTEAINQFAARESVSVEQSTQWFPLTFPWDLLEINNYFLSRLNAGTEGAVEEFTRVKGKVQIGKGSIIRSGAYIEGPVYIGKNCIIGPNCFIRPHTSIGDRCKVGNAVEIKNSILMDDVNIGHLSYVGDSIVGSGTNFGAGTITANLRHDDKNVWSEVRDVKTDTGMRKLGTIVGNDVHTGIHTSIYPGRKIWPHETTLPGEIVRADIR